MIYLDHNATSPLCSAARAAWMEAQERFFANPSSQHRPGQRAERALESARETVAEILCCSPEDLIWTSGATEAANSALSSLAQTTDGTFLISPVEHPCVLEPAGRWFHKRCRLLNCDSNGRVDPLEVRFLLETGRVGAVAVMAANNETGVIQPWEQIRDLCREFKVPFVCDATQWVGRYPLSGLGECDYVFGSTHKAGGPVGSGFLKIPSRLPVKHWRSLLSGGTQEAGRRAGTQDVAGVLALEATLRDRESRLAELASRVASRSSIERSIKVSTRRAAIVAEEADRLWNTVSVLLPEPPDCRRRWVVRLDAAGIAASSGSACSSGKEAPSHVLRAMGLGDFADRIVRLSGGWETTADDWNRAVETITRITRDHTAQA